MDESVVIDCVTKEARRAPLKASEKAQRHTDDADHISRQRADAEEAKKRDTIMAKLAAAAGVDVDDLKVALRVGRPS